MQSPEEFLHALDPTERGRVISVLRSACGMTRDELAKKAKVSPNTISDWEKGKIRNPRALFAKLQPVLDLSLASIQHALVVIRDQWPRSATSEVGETVGSYDHAAIDESGFPEVQGMTSLEIDDELLQLSSKFGQMVFRVVLLATERAARSGQRSTS